MGSTSEYNRKRIDAIGRDKFNALQRVKMAKWRRENPERSLWRIAKDRAKKQNREFSIEVSDIFIPKYCPVLGIEMVKNRGRVKDSSPTLDRIDNSKGYVKGNIIVISWRANHLKGDSTLAELELLVKFLRKLNGGHNK